MPKSAAQLRASSIMGMGMGLDIRDTVNITGRTCTVAGAIGLMPTEGIIPVITVGVIQRDIGVAMAGDPA